MKKSIIAIINGKFNNKVPITNRNLQYGDGIFETCIIKDSKLLFWHKHYQRLKLGCDRLNIVNIANTKYLRDIQKLINRSNIKNGIIKIIVSRGNSNRGYRYNAIDPVRIITISKLEYSHNNNFELSICTSGYQKNNILSGIKHCNRLENILASADITGNDCIMLDDNDNVISSTFANIFIVKNNILITPDTSNCGINGTRRDVILELAKSLNISHKISKITIDDIRDANEVFITNSVLGIQKITKFQNTNYKQYPITDLLTKIFKDSEFESKIVIKPKISVIKLLVTISIIFMLMFVYANKTLKLKNNNAIIHIKPNTTLTQISKQLKTQNLIHSYYYFIALAKLFNKEKNLQAGYYLIKPNTDTLDLLLNINKGNVIKHTITLVEGKTSKEYFNILQKNPNIISNNTIEQTLVEAGIKYPYEGMIAPDTYQFNHKTKASDIFKQAHNQAKKILKEMWANRDKSIAIKNPYQAVILASLIEKETAYNNEKAQISGVFNRRLKYNMRLQTDPSIIYALGDNYKPPLKRDDLYINSPYNTYIHKGLPPTAIGSIGKKSLYYALHPDASEDLYFVSKKDGRHAFSKTYKQHLDNINKYLKNK